MKLYLYGFLVWGFTTIIIFLAPYLVAYPNKLVSLIGSLSLIVLTPIILNPLINLLINELKKNS